MEYKKCKVCGDKYGYFDSPPMDNCFCGGELEICYEAWAESTKIIFDSTNVHYATVSC